MKKVLFTAIGATLLLSACCFQPKNDESFCISKVPYPRLNQNSVDQGWLRYADMQINEANEARVIFLGDSITDDFRKPKFNEAWKSEFGKFNPANMGISGDATQHVLFRLNLLRQKYPEANPELFFLMIGTNNLGWLNQSVEDSIEGTLEIVRYLRKNYPDAKVIVSTLTPTRSTNSTCTVERITALDAGVKLGLKNEFSNDPMISEFDSTTPLLDAQGNQVKSFFRDDCHMTPAGAMVWAKAIRPAIEKQLKCK